MALALTYTTLKAMLQTWTEDNNTEFVAEIDRIIGLAELKLLRDLDLEIFDTTATGAFTLGVQEVTKPTGLVALRTLTFVNASSEIVYLERKTYEYLNEYWPVAATLETPKYYTELNETQWRVVPTSDSAYTFTVRYTKRPTGLSASNENTFLSDNVADLLFLAAQIESEIYLKVDPEDVGNFQTFKANYAERLPAAKLELIRTERADYRPVAAVTAPTQ